MKKILFLIIILAVAEAVFARDHGEALQYFFYGDYPEALEEAKKANFYYEKTDMKEYLSKLCEITKDFNEYEIGHFRVRLKRNDTPLKPYLEKTLEKIYQSIGAEFNYFPQDKILIEVYPTKEEFAVASTLGEETIERSGAIAICKFNRLMITSPSALPQGYRWIDTISHEYIHFTVNSVSGEKCPLWLHEGIARYYDTSWRKSPPEYMSAGNESVLVQALKDKKLIPFGRMAPSLVYLKDQSEVNLAFIEVSNSVEYMNKAYPGALKEVLAKIREMGGENLASPASPAFKKVLGTTVEKFEKDWIKYTGMLNLKESKGAVPDKIRWKKYDEMEEFVGVSARDYVRLGDKFRKNDFLDIALVQYDKALALEPFNPVVLFKKSRALVTRRKIDEAEQALVLCTQKNPNYVTSYEFLGEIYLATGRYSLASEAFFEAVSINPFNPITRRNLEISDSKIPDKQPGK